MLNISLYNISVISSCYPVLLVELTKVLRENQPTATSHCQNVTTLTKFNQYDLTMDGKSTYNFSSHS
jgi:hypothetical protein